MTSPSRALLFLLAASACALDGDRDRSPAAVDCDDADPGRSTKLDEVLGDGIDQDCDGSDAPTLPIRDVAAGRYHSDLRGAKLGWRVTCGPDRGGDGQGDLAATASEFGLNSLLVTFAAALPGPRPGEHLIEDVLDLRVRPSDRAGFDLLIGLVEHDAGGGMLLGNIDNMVNAPLYTEVV